MHRHLAPLFTCALVLAAGVAMAKKADRIGVGSKGRPSAEMASGPTTTYYIDNTLPASCGTYTVATRSCGTGTLRAFKTWKEATGTVHPGDSVVIRGGTFTHGNGVEGPVLSRSGTVVSPISWSVAAGETAIIRGQLDVDTDGDGVRDMDEDAGTSSCGRTPTCAAGPSPINRNLGGFRISGDYNYVSGSPGFLVVEWFHSGCSISGNNNRAENNIICRHSWLSNFTITGSNNVVQYIVTHHSRHQKGFQLFSNRVSLTPSGNLYRRVLSYGNGRHCTNTACTSDDRVPPYRGDPQGGGNSFGWGTFKGCVHNAPASGNSNNCRNNTVQETVSWRNTDGGGVPSWADSFQIANMMIDSKTNGPAMKHFIKVGCCGTGANYNNLISGEIYADTEGSGARGAEIRANGDFRVLHNLAIRNPGAGYVAAGSAGSNQFRNNVARLNGVEFQGFGSAWTTSNNWNGDTQGNPGLVNENATWTFPEDDTVAVATRWANIWGQVRAAVRTAAGSGLRDAGVAISGYHCAKADDDPISPEPPTSACRHWAGSAPDLGPFEHNIPDTFNDGSGNPDKTRCALYGCSR
jgi:hypothetical protein